MDIPRDIVRQRTAELRDDLRSSHSPREVAYLLFQLRRLEDVERRLDECRVPPDSVGALARLASVFSFYTWRFSLTRRRSRPI